MAAPDPGALPSTGCPSSTAIDVVAINTTVVSAGVPGKRIFPGTV